jgi:hypothetical protein
MKLAPYPRLRLLLCSVLAIGFLAFAPHLAPIVAQDTTASEVPTATATWTDVPTPTPTLTPSPVPTDTETPTATATETATVTPTETATASPTESFTPEVTATTDEPTVETTADIPTDSPISSDTPMATRDSGSPTATASLTPTATATATANLPPEPELKLLFTDTFDTGALYLWQPLGLGWSLVDSEGGKALQVTNSDEPVTFVYNTLNDVAVQARFMFDTGMVRMSARQSEAGSYTVVLSANGQLALFRGSQILDQTTVAPNSPQQWRTLRLSAIGNIVRVSVDGTQVLVKEDDTALGQGTFSFAVVGMGNVPALVDDVSLWSNTDTATLTPTPSPETPVPVGSPTPTNIPPSGKGTSALSRQSRLTAQSQSTVITLTTNNQGDLVNAINAGNGNGGACPANPTIINLQPSVTYDLSSVTESFYGNNGLPRIKCDITINGNHSLVRRVGTQNFRILAIDSTGKLTLNDVTISNGAATQIGGSGIFNYFGSLYLFNSTVSNNITPDFGLPDQIVGGGIYSYQGQTVSIQDSTISNNQVLGVAGDGGGLGVLGATNTTIKGTTIRNNLAHRNGGGLIFSNNINATISFSDIRYNQTDLLQPANGTAIYNNSQWLTVSDSCIVNNSATAFYNGNPTTITATRVWWGSASPTANDIFNVNATSPQTSEPLSCTTNDYNVYVAVPAGTASDDRQKLQDAVRKGVHVVAGSLATRFASKITGYTYNQTYPFEPDPTIFKRIMLGGDNNKIGFVFISMAGVSIPSNVNAPNPNTNYLNYGRVCPFYLSLRTANQQPGGTGGIPTNFTLPNGTIAALDATNSSLKTSEHQALIVCDINQVSNFSDWVVAYNLGLVFINENGGLVSDPTKIAPQATPSFYGAFENPNVSFIGDDNAERVMGSSPELKYCSNLNGMPIGLAQLLSLPCKGMPAVRGDWERGRRGWGSPAPIAPITATYDIIGQTCGWQENPIDVFDYRTAGPNATVYQQYEFSAAAADMFLNWAYHYQNPDILAAFANVTWIPNNVQGSCSFTTYTVDSAHPGDARMSWIDSVAFARVSVFFR